MKQSEKISSRLKTLKGYAVFSLVGHIFFVLAGSIGKVNDKGFANLSLLAAVAFLVIFVVVLFRYFSIKKSGRDTPYKENCSGLIFLFIE